MTRNNIEIKYIKNGTSYGAMPYGQFSGQPTVSLKLSSSDSNSIKVNSLENIFSSRGWKQKLRSGYARLRIYGDDVFHDRHTESIEYFLDVIDPRFVDIEMDEKDIQSKPSTFIKRRVDTYSFVIDATRDEPRYDKEVFTHILDNNANNGNAQYIFKSDTVTCEDRVKQFSRDYNVYDSDIWMYPKGTKRKTIDDNRESIENVAKRNCWNVSPRLDVSVNVEETETD